MAVATVISRVLGLAREMVYAAFMGVTGVADAFLLAFTIPNLFRRLLGEGALTTAFIPVFKEKEKLAGEKEMWRTANAVLSALTIGTSGLTGLAVGGISLVLLAGPQPKTFLLLRLLQIMFPYLISVCVAAVFMAILNARGHFFVPALGSAMLNLVMIASVLWLAPQMGEGLGNQILGVAIGVVAAGVMQAIFQWPLLHREGFRFEWISPWKEPTVRVVIERMIPGVVGVAAFQINVLLTKSLAFGVQTGIVSSFDYAVRLMEFPQGVFGVSLAAYLLPTLSGLFAEKKYDDFRATIAQAMGYVIFVNLLAAVLLLALAEPMVRLLFERRAFDEAATARTVSALLALAPGLLAFSAVNILARGFHAVGDTRTPMKISVFCLVLNLLIAGALVWPLKQTGLGIANTLTSTLNAVLLIYALRRKMGRLNWSILRAHVPGLLGAALVVGLLAWRASEWWQDRFGHETLLHKSAAVFIPIAIAAFLYLLVARWLKVPFVADLMALLRIGRRSAR